MEHFDTILMKTCFQKNTVCIDSLSFGWLQQFFAGNLVVLLLEGLLNEL